MIFDYILNNRFYAPDFVEHVDPFVPSGESSNEPPNPYADIIPTAPHNRLETFLNMIVGNTFKALSADYVAADPIKPISEMEYWLNEIAAAKGGNPWKDAAGKFVAKKISFKVGEAPYINAYSLIIDTGLKDFPYETFSVKVEANGCEFSTITDNAITAENIIPLSAEVKSGDVFANPDALAGAAAFLGVGGGHPEIVIPGDPGLYMDSITVLFIKNGSDTIKAQVLMTFSTVNFPDFVPYNHEADELVFDTFDLKFVEGEKKA